MKQSLTSMIDLVNLSAGYGRNVLFRDLNLSLRKGELVCFMGPNGIGKSTLIKTLGGILKPLSGSIVYHGSPLLMEQLVSVVLTDPVRASYMTVYELVVFGRYPYLNWRLDLDTRDKELVEMSLDQVNIRHLRDSPLSQLSDGQKQMAMIARALAQDTPVIILDEPTAHLDLNNRLEIMKILRNLTRTLGKAILLATHELDLALQTADLIWLAGKDSNIVTGIPEDLVLQGAFDEVFRFKGFDLKTGKVQHETFRRKIVSLKGEGHAYLWTRNLLERNGYSVADYGDIQLAIHRSGNGIQWTINGSDNFSTLEAVLIQINRIAES